MSFDGMMVHAITDELQQIVSGRINKIYQPYERDIVFHIRANGQNHKLFLSANPTHPRIHLTDERFQNPKEAPMFCMVLRKYFEGGFIERIEQKDAERIIYMDIKAKDELGDTVSKRIIFEIMGRHSNLIVLDPEQNIILDSIHHVTQAINQHRTVLPGRPYVAPPEQNKINPFEVDRDTFMKKMNFNAGQLDQQIVTKFSGISPLLAQEMLYQSPLPHRDTLADTFLMIMEKIKHKQFEPTIMTRDNKSAFYFFPLQHLLQDGQSQSFSTLSAMIHHFYHGKAERDRLKQRAHDLIRFLSNEKKKNEKKIKKLHKTIKESEKADQYQLYGELLTAFMHQVKRGDTEIQVQNYYDEQGGMITIGLDPQKTPNENAQDYFKKYNKTKKSKAAAHKQIQLAEKEIQYFDGLLQQLEQASAQDVEEIREELVEGQYLRNRQGQKKKKKKKDQPALTKYVSSEGIPILVGKNNKQNEYLTNRLANSQDTWLHTKDIPGSHVVIRSSNFSEDTLLQAAQIAAYYSKARESSQVPVDYTLVKHVRKPSGAKPGYVIYEQKQTVFVTPREEQIKQLEEKSSSSP